MHGLSERTVIVTGAASGIGEATAERLVRERARVLLVDRDVERLQSVATRLTDDGGQVATAATDVSQEADVQRAVDAAVSRFGALHGLVTSAGIFHPGDMQPLAEVSLDTFQTTLGINLVGTFLFAKYALPHLIAAGGGAIVTIASTAGVRGHGFGAGYTASKGGVVALTRLLAMQYGEHNIRTNCICPGATDTPMTGGAWGTDESRAQMRRAIPLGRVAQPSEIGNVACFLLSDDGWYVNGQILPVDGGATVK
jgi:NAD(P)-dependent dehydrogenase (short-subunit alcohol dehydrogenase family)